MKKIIKTIIAGAIISGAALGFAPAAFAATGESANVHNELRGWSVGQGGESAGKPQVREMNITRDGNKAPQVEVNWSHICDTTGGAGNLPAHC